MHYKLPGNIVSFSHKHFEFIQIWLRFFLQHFQFVFLATFAQNVVVEQDEGGVPTVGGGLEVVL
jgi:hypothetical protein